MYVLVELANVVTLAKMLNLPSVYTVTTVKAILVTDLLIELRMHFLQNLAIFILVLSELGRPHDAFPTTLPVADGDYQSVDVR